MIDHEICGMLWDVSRMLADCEAGVFGPPVTLAMSVLDKYESPPGALDPARVAAFKELPAVLATPAVAILTGALLILPGGDAASVPAAFFLADGNHRVAALRELGAETFAAYVVPTSHEIRYRLGLAPLLHGHFCLGLELAKQLGEATAESDQQQPGIADEP